VGVGSGDLFGQRKRRKTETTEKRDGPFENDGLILNRAESYSAKFILARDARSSSFSSTTEAAFGSSHVFGRRIGKHWRSDWELATVICIYAERQR
jgi:hypothetical protein